MTRRITLANTYYVQVCPTAGCGVQVVTSDEFDNRRRDDGRQFYCPNGHVIIYNGGKPRAEQERDEARREATRLQAELDRSKAEARGERRARVGAERSAAATRGWITRLKRRIAAGVCPCCRRPFRAVLDHIRNQHPDFVEKWGTEVLQKS